MLITGECGGDCECSDFNLCLRAFEIKVTIPSDRFGDLAGTYEMNQEGYFPGIGNRYHVSSCMQMCYISDELEIILETSYQVKLGSYWTAQVFSDNGNALYGLTYAKGIVQDSGQGIRCQATCDGEFQGTESRRHFIKSFPDGDITAQNAHIHSVPGKFSIPRNNIWSATGILVTENNQQNYPAYGVGDCYFYCDYERTNFESNPASPLDVSWQLREPFTEVPEVLYEAVK